MDSKIKASFIPDKALKQSTYSGKSHTAGGISDITFLLSVVVFAAVLALATGVFLYDRFLIANVDKKSALVEKARGSFDPVLIQNMLRLDERLNAASDILAQHLAPSEVFAVLESLTLQSVEYTSLKYGIRNDGKIRIEMDGVAQSVNGVALQSSVFGEQNAIINPIFSNINFTDKGVSFSVSASLDPLVLQYALVAKKRIQTQTQTIPSQTATTTRDGIPLDATQTATPTKNIPDNSATLPGNNLPQ